MALREKNEKFLRDAERLLDLFPNHVETIFYIQECEFEEMKRQNPELRKFCRTLRKPLAHLNFRSAFRGQIQDCYILRFEASPDVRMCFVDANSVFPAQALQHDMPTKSYHVFMISEQQQGDISFRGDDMFFCGFRALGVALVR